MILQHRIAAIYISLILSTTACVSVNIKPKAPEKAKAYSFSAPGLPFEKVSAEQADFAFKDAKSGHTIAMISECSENVDPSLDSLESDLVSALSSSHELKKEQIQFNGRTAIRSSHQGEMDGVAVQMEILVFKKNSCSYSLTLVGRSKAFDASKKIFEGFTKGFIVP